MDTLNLIFQFIKVIGIIVTIHELGHFLAARACGMRAEIFALGMGYRLFGWNKITGFTFGSLPADWDGNGYTDYRLCLLPIGGYVKISGMVDESMDATQMASEPKPWEFRSKNAFQKALVISAGVIMNFILSIGIYSGIAASEGRDESLTRTVASVKSESALRALKPGDEILAVNGRNMKSWEDIMAALTLENLGENRSILVKGSDGVQRTVNADGKALTEALTQKKGLGISPEGMRIVAVAVETLMPAGKAGLKSGDTLVSVNGIALAGAEEFVSVVAGNKEKPLTVVWKRGNTEQTSIINPQYDGAVNRWRIGIQPGQVYTGPVAHIDYSAGEALSRGIEQTSMSVGLFFKTITSIFQGKMSFRESIGGPVQIARIAGQQAERGMADFLLLVASLSVSIAVINILPFPALDGGHLVFIIIEGVLRREVPLKVKMGIQQVGVALLFLLFIFITVNDLFKR
jgi:regulator of sigma E protease